MVGRAPRTSSVKTAPGSAHILIIESRYYDAIADELIAGAVGELAAGGATYERVEVAGALEIPQALALAAGAGRIPRGAQGGPYDGAIAIGCVIRGETSHYDIVVNNANHWLMETAITYRIPLGNAVLTVDTEAQAMARAQGGRDGKGGDAARAVLGLLGLVEAFAGDRS